MVYKTTHKSLLLFTHFLSTFVTSIITIMNSRLKQFLIAENISQSQFADTIKVVRASVSHVLAGRNKPGYDFIKAIMVAYPHLNMEWLIMGQGKMYKSTTSQQTETEIPLLFNYDQSDDPDSDETTFESEPAPQDDTTMFQDQQHIPHHPTKSISDRPQSFDRQRKATKVVVLYDDGTYQELQIS